MPVAAGTQLGSHLVRVFVLAHQLVDVCRPDRGQLGPGQLGGEELLGVGTAGIAGSPRPLESVFSS